MKYYATVAAASSVEKSQDTVERIERRVLDSNPIMEAFGKKADHVALSVWKLQTVTHLQCLFFVGNACTLRNNNSSRFGKYIQLQLDRHVHTHNHLQCHPPFHGAGLFNQFNIFTWRCQLLVGASVQTYLLEKTRVANQPANERNFHIFYQVKRPALTWLYVINFIISMHEELNG